MFKYTATLTLTVEKVYGENETDLIAALGDDGYNVLAFRPPMKGERYLTAGNGEVIVAKKSTYNEPRLILSQDWSWDFETSMKPEDAYGLGKTEANLVPAGFRAVDFRPPTAGDTFVNVKGKVTTGHTLKLNQPRFIVTRA